MEGGRADSPVEDPCSNCSQCARADREARGCRSSRSVPRSNSASHRRRDRRRRRAGTSTGRHSHRSRSSRRSSGGRTRGASPSRTRASSRAESPAGSGGQSPARTATTRTGTGSARSSAVSPEEEARRCQTSRWPHKLSFLFCLISCMLGMFSMSRFAILTIHFGVVFLLQFLLLSFCFGIPLFTLFCSLGQYLGSGLIDMWRISPIFQGIGVSLLLVQGLAGVYNILISSWMFVYFRDSFITVYENYRWTECQSSQPSFEELRHCSEESRNGSLAHRPLEVTVPDYFAAAVLRRSSPDFPIPAFGNPKFQVAFNLVVIWMVVFICLSKGLRSYGKVVYVFMPLSTMGFLIFVSKVLGEFPLGDFQDWLYNQEWSAFMYNSKSWVCAARECFFTWAYFGGSLLQLAAHNKFRHNLRRDTAIAIMATLLFLVLSGMLGVAVNRHLQASRHYSYTPSSFETYRSYYFLELPYGRDGGSPSIHQEPPLDTLDHVSFLAGIRIIQPGRDPLKYSGYQVHRLGTELIPTYLAIIGPAVMSPFWAVLFYFTLILLGISQCLSLFNTVIQGLVAIKPSTLKSWEGTITFCCCTIGFLLGLPMSTEIGIFVVYFLDYTMGCGWWVMVLYLIQIFAIFIVRGRPYSADRVASALFPRKDCTSGWLAPLLAFTWTVVMPIGLLIMAVVTFKTGLVGEMFDWSLDSGYVYLPSWVREIGSMMQLMPLLIVPFVGVIQSCRYFLKGPQSLFTRLELLYRPTFSLNPASTASRGRSSPPEVVLTNFSQAAASPTPPPANDPPPKYTPPPSYSTATGARIARMIRQSFRRSVRRLQELNSNRFKDLTHANLGDLPPPDYATVVIEADRRQHQEDDDIYLEPRDALNNFPTRGVGAGGAPPFLATEVGSYSLDLGALGLTRLERRSIRGVPDVTPARPDHPIGRIIALGVGNLQRADSEAVLVETAEPIHCDTESGSENSSDIVERDLGARARERSHAQSQLTAHRSMGERDHRCERSTMDYYRERDRDFGEIVFLEREGEMLAHFQEEAINLEIIRDHSHQPLAYAEAAASATPGGRDHVLKIDLDTSDSVI